MAAYEGHATKRQRTDVGGRGVQQGSRVRYRQVVALHIRENMGSLLSVLVHQHDC